MVELRKRPQREPPAPAPALKKSRAAKGKAVPAHTATDPAAESSTAATAPAAEPAPTGVVGKAKRAASKVKEAIAGSESGTTESAAKQPSVEDEPPAAVETGETGMIAETAGTAPNTTTIPASADAGAAASSAVPPAAPVAEAKKGRGKLKAGATATNDPATTSTAVAPVAAPPAPESTTTASAVVQPPQAVPSAKPIRGKAKTPVMSPPPVAAATAATVPASDAAAQSTTDETRPPATEDLENPPETGKVDTTSSATATSSADTATTPLSPSSVGKQIPTTLGGPTPLTTHTGKTHTFSDLLSSSRSGIIIFTYPRASTPGCTQQACAFRDNQAAFSTSSGYTIYGLSTDSVKANAGFASKQGLQYELLCDMEAKLTGDLGMKKAGNAKGTLRGVVVVDKAGVVRVWFQGGPGKTVDAVKEFLAAAA